MPISENEVGPYESDKVPHNRWGNKLDEIGENLGLTPQTEKSMSGRLIVHGESKL